MVGDAAIAAFFSAEKPKQREEVRRRMQSLVEADLKKEGFIAVDGEVDSAIKKLRKGSKGIVPFHWELEFPEVFTTDEKGQVIGRVRCDRWKSAFRWQEHLVRCSRRWLFAMAADAPCGIARQFRSSRTFLPTSIHSSSREWAVWPDCHQYHRSG